MGDLLKVSSLPLSHYYNCKVMKMIKSKMLFVCIALSLFVLSVLVLRHAQGAKEEKMIVEIDSLYREREAIDSNLRSQIVGLQNKIVKIPKIFSKNKRAVLIDMIHANFAIEATEKISDKEVINQLFSRDQRRDLFAGKVVVQTLNNQLFYSVGVTDEHGEYTGAVEKNLLQSKNVAADFQRVTTMVNSDLPEENGKVNYEEKIAILKQMSIDSAFEAEKTRLEFVSNEKDVATINKKFVEASQTYQKEWFNTALLILAANILFAMVFVIVFFRNRSPQGNVSFAEPNRISQKKLASEGRAIH
jgi:hypothetical protein